MTKKLELPKYCFARGNKIWTRMKNESGVWENSPTPFTIDQPAEAKRWVSGWLRKYELARNGANAGDMTVREYGQKWCDERDSRSVACVPEDRARLDRYAYPSVGDVRLSEFKPKNALDLVRKLKALREEDGTPTISSRTVLHVYSTLHNLFAGALVDELVTANPVIVRRGELPQKQDADPEWRSQATYTVGEVTLLMTSPLVPLERRVMYALKALTGMRHGEAAALCFRHIDESATPLPRITVAQAWCSRESIVKRTKTGSVHAVPVVEALARILTEWRTKHWQRIYGRAPTSDDFVVPARTMRCVNASDAGEYMKRDLTSLGLRVEAGKLRDRGGHDLRSWYQTRMIEDGADSLIIRRTTHAPPKDVNSGYERFSWQAVCREASKLRIPLPKGELLRLPNEEEAVTHSLQSEANASNRWRKVATPTGFEPHFFASKESEDQRSSSDRSLRPSAVSATSVTTARYRVIAEVGAAIRDLDLTRASALLGRLREIEASTVITHVEPVELSKRPRN